MIFLFFGSINLHKFISFDLIFFSDLIFPPRSYRLMAGVMYYRVCADLLQHRTAKRVSNSLTQTAGVLPLKLAMIRPALFQLVVTIFARRGPLIAHRRPHIKG